MTNADEQTKSATAVAVAVFDFVRFGSEEGSVRRNAAIEVIRAYGDRRTKRPDARAGEGCAVAAGQEGQQVAAIGLLLILRLIVSWLSTGNGSAMRRAAGSYPARPARET